MIDDRPGATAGDRDEQSSLYETIDAFLAANGMDQIPVPGSKLPPPRPPKPDIKHDLPKPEPARPAKKVSRKNPLTHRPASDPKLRDAETRRMFAAIAGGLPRAVLAACKNELDRADVHVAAEGSRRLASEVLRQWEVVCVVLMAKLDIADTAVTGLLDDVGRQALAAYNKNLLGEATVDALRKQTVQLTANVAASQRKIDSISLLTSLLVVDRLSVYDDPEHQPPINAADVDFDDKAIEQVASVAARHVRMAEHRDFKRDNPNTRRG